MAERRPGAMVALQRAGSPAVITVLGLSLIITACAATMGDRTDPSASGASTSATPAASSAASPDAAALDTPSAVPSDPPAATGGALDPTTPTACLTLGAPDCAAARDLAATVIALGDPPVRAIQVGPFACATNDACPATLTARPEGDVVVEFDGGAGINVHLKVAIDGTFEATRQPAMGVAVAPTSAAGIPAGPIEFTLGHCGVFSGIDFDASWWDPVGPVATDSGEAVNATAGVITVIDPDHATFTTPTGFSLQLQRHDGEKLLPFCM